MRTAFISLLFALGFPTFSHAQTSFSCTHREYCDWDKIEKKYNNCEGYDESSLFEMNKNETMFSHTIKSMTSTYYVKSKEYDDKNDVWEYVVVSDVGNKYIYIFDPKNYQIRALYTNEGNTKMIVFTVKSIF